jgi:hypothetical protein
VPDDRVERLGGDHRALGLVVGVREQRPELLGGQEEAVRLVVDAMDGHAHAVQESGRRHHDLGVASAHRVVADDRRLDAPADQQAQESQRDVDHDPDVHPRVVRHAEAVGVDVLHVPPRLELVVGVRGAEERLQAAVPAGGSADLDALHRLSGAGRARLRRPRRTARRAGLVAVGRRR